MATELNMGMKCIKYMLLTVNIMFVFTAALIMSIGTAIYAIYNQYHYFILDKYLSPASLLIAIGIIMLAVSTFGVWGAAKESTVMINIFALLLTMVFVLEISAAIAAYSLQSGLYELIEGNLKVTQANYMNNAEAKSAFDLIQNSLSCCGIQSADDWRGHLGSNTTVGEDMKVPLSCCPPEIIDNGSLTVDDFCRVSLSYKDGCMDNLHFVISQSAVLLGTGATTIAFIQFIGIVFSFMLGKEIRKAKTDRERRRFEIRQNIVNNYTQMEPYQGKCAENPAPYIYVPTIGHSKS